MYLLLREEREEMREFYKGAVTKRIHSAIEVTTNGAGILCGEERQQEEDGTRL